MPLLAWCQWIESTALSAALRESTWGFPILGALHVLGIAWFGGALLVASYAEPDLAAQLRPLTRLGLAAMLLTGALLFWVEPLKCYHSTAFWVKMALLVLLAVVPGRNRLAAACSLALWAAVILAARAIAFL